MMAGILGAVAFVKSVIYDKSLKMKALSASLMALGLEYGIKGLCIGIVGKNKPGTA